MRLPFKIRGKIWLSVAIVVLGFFISTVVSFYLSMRINEQSGFVQKHSFPVAMKSQAALISFEDQLGAYEDVVLAGETDELETAEEKAGESLSHLKYMLANHEITPSQKDLGEKILARLEKFTEQASPEYRKMASVPFEQWDEETARKAGELAREKESLKGMLEKLEKNSADDLENELKSVAAFTNMMQTINIAVFVAAIVLSSVVVSLLVSRLITRPLARTVTMIERLGQGDYSHRLEIDSRDEIGQMARAMDNLAVLLEETEKELSAHRNRLEALVKERTSELESVNVKLQDQIKERTKIEEQLRQSQKMEAIGRLAGGVAHDFNNLLMAITGYSELLMNELDEKDQNFPMVVEIKKAADRAAGLTGQLLAFSRKQVLQPAVINLNRAVANMDKMLRRLIGEDIEMQTRLEPGLGSIKADPSQVEQVIVNLAVNARDAMPEGGKLTIETDNVFVDEAYAEDHMDASPGEHVMLAISDTGTGMDEETLKKIFEPFYTTKEMGKGTGLGLSTVYGIVTQSGGHLNVYSEPREGTTFKIYLPRVTDESREEKKTRSYDGAAGGDETILLVEDEDGVRGLLLAVLQSKGYKVLTACNGKEALEVASDYDEVINLLVTDVIMPEMNGRELSDNMKFIHPEAEALFISGYPDNHIVQKGILEPDTEFLQKPLSPNLLLARVREILDKA